MSIEQTADVDEQGRSLNPKKHTRKTQDNAPQGTETVDWQGLTPASNANTLEEPKRARDAMGDKVVSEQNYPGAGANTANDNEMPAEGNQVFPDKPQRGVELNRSPEPDARDDEKVERLAAPDWRSEQPLPSAKNAVDPRGENTPPELFEDTDERDKK